MLNRLSELAGIQPNWRFAAYRNQPELPLGLRSRVYEVNIHLLCSGQNSLAKLYNSSRS